MCIKLGKFPSIPILLRIFLLQMHAFSASVDSIMTFLLSLLMRLIILIAFQMLFPKFFMTQSKSALRALALLSLCPFLRLKERHSVRACSEVSSEGHYFTKFSGVEDGVWDPVSTVRVQRSAFSLEKHSSNCVPEDTCVSQGFIGLPRKAVCS